jgi:hypothetical protein
MVLLEGRCCDFGPVLRSRQLIQWSIGDICLSLISTKYAYKSLSREMDKYKSSSLSPLACSLSFINPGSYTELTGGRPCCNRQIPSLRANQLAVTAH